MVTPCAVTYDMPFTTTIWGVDAKVKTVLLSSTVPVAASIEIADDPEVDTKSLPVTESILKGSVTVLSVFDCPRATVILFPSRIASDI